MVKPEFFDFFDHSPRYETAPRRTGDSIPGSRETSSAYISIKDISSLHIIIIITYIICILHIVIYIYMYVYVTAISSYFWLLKGSRLMFGVHNDSTYTQIH